MLGSWGSPLPEGCHSRLRGPRLASLCPPPSPPHVSGTAEGAPSPPGLGEGGVAPEPGFPSTHTSGVEILGLVPITAPGPRGQQRPPGTPTSHPHDAWGSPARLPLLSTPNWQLLLGSCSWKLPSVWNHPRSPSPCPPPTGQTQGGIASGHCCRAGGQQVGGPEGWVREGARVILTLGRRTGGTLVDHFPGNTGAYP